MVFSKDVLMSTLMKNPASEVGRKTKTSATTGSSKRAPCNAPMRIEVRGDDLLSVKKRKKGKLSRERGINGLVRAGHERLCRESPFTAFPSEAIFAVTDDLPTSKSQKINAPMAL